MKKLNIVVIKNSMDSVRNIFVKFVFAMNKPPTNAPIPEITWIVELKMPSFLFAFFLFISFKTKLVRDIFDMLFPKPPKVNKSRIIQKFFEVESPKV